MTELTRPTVPKWPFFIGDAFMLGLAWFVYQQSKTPLEPFAIGAICACVALGALLAILPFVLEYRVILKVAEAEALTSVVEQVQNLEGIARQISLATGQWQTVNDHSTKAVAAATEIGEKMATEARAFAQSMQKANDTEKATLRLEVEKLRRSETDWLQVVVRMLDHTFALHSAAVRSGKTALIEQLSQFQNALRDAARRVGLTVLTAQPGESFNPEKHQASEGEKPETGDVISTTLAAGYTFRGQRLRHVLVSVAQPKAEEAVAAELMPNSSSPGSEPPQEQTLF